jgi:hypothetical protein
VKRIGWQYHYDFVSRQVIERGMVSSSFVVVAAEAT